MVVVYRGTLSFIVISDRDLLSLCICIQLERKKSRYNKYVKNVWGLSHSQKMFVLQTSKFWYFLGKDDK